MELSGARTLVVGATGVLGGALTEALRDQGATLALAGRTEPAGADGEPTFTLDALDLERCAAVVDEAADALGGLDLVLVAIGVAGFGEEAENDVVTEHLLTVNAQAPMAIGRAALARFPSKADGGGTLAMISAILADVPTPGMAAYSASKAALSAWLTATRGGVRRQGVRVLDIRPPHIGTGLADRAVAGTVPSGLKEGSDVGTLVGQVLQALRDDRRTVTFDLRSGEYALG
ncbi:SDR family oxidoreductase [Pseudonocardia sp. ICBG1293]|uniref:SDR family NAD(P)-dependent oxidoreductase n=1 Tax=Pseudonocardia sp. ICBG1293 TaxID=2844382 RepID=UPI001CCD1F94|nr:SDR family NAD(P)-dependent oxidoreductase [Pseudonocardia sp. ICBG1293]